MRLSKGKHPDPTVKEGTGDVFFLDEGTRRSCADLAETSGHADETKPRKKEGASEPSGSAAAPRALEEPAAKSLSAKERLEALRQRVARRGLGSTSCPT